ncbi:MAG: class I SAM-dependent methyltransferase [Candidatus Limnocylindrales bacterium]|nr:class I SAM-dependent methyltransferase [Candidatus Limnocylindrales bacterium]
MATAKDVVRTQYQGEAGHQYHAVVHNGNDEVSDIVARHRVRKFQPLVHPDDIVFEYGVGTGLNLRHLKCRRRVGYDLSEAGRAECERAGIEFVSDLSGASPDVSVVICHHALEHVPDPLDSLEQMHALLRPGGRLILCVPLETLRRYRRYVPNDPNHHLFSWNALTLGNVVTAAGFVVRSVRIAPFGYEQRLAVLSRYLGDQAYRCGLAVVRTLRPADEVCLQASRL